MAVSVCTASLQRFTGPGTVCNGPNDSKQPSQSSEAVEVIGFFRPLAKYLVHLCICSRPELCLVIPRAVAGILNSKLLWCGYRPLNSRGLSESLYTKTSPTMRGWPAPEPSGRGQRPRQGRPARARPAARPSAGLPELPRRARIGHRRRRADRRQEGGLAAPARAREESPST